MAILFAGGIGADFDTNSGIIDSTSSSFFDPLYAFSGMRPVDSLSNITYELRNSNQKSIWFHWREATTGGTGNGQSFYFSAFSSNNFNLAGMLRNTTSSSGHGTLKIRLYNGTTETGVINDSGSFSAPFDTVSYWDLHIEIGEVDMTFTAYRNGAVSATLTVPKGSRDDIKSFKITPHAKNNNTNIGISEVIVSDTPTLNFRLSTLKVDSLFENNGMEGDVLNLNDPKTNLGMLSNSAEQSFLWNPSAYGGSEGEIAAVVSSLRATRVGGVPSKLIHQLKLGDTIFNGSLNLIGISSQNQEIWGKNPVTQEAWTSDQLASLKFGLISKN